MFMILCLKSGMTVKNNVNLALQVNLINIMNVLLLVEIDDNFDILYLVLIYINILVYYIIKNIYLYQKSV